MIYEATYIIIIIELLWSYIIVDCVDIIIASGGDFGVNLYLCINYCIYD